MAGTDDKDRNPWLYGQDAPPTPGPSVAAEAEAEAGGGTRVFVDARDVP